jgi:hypothetical protein
MVVVGEEREKMMSIREVDGEGGRLDAGYSEGHIQQSPDRI